MPVQLPPTFGALFDWDGVIVDSKQLHRAAWDEVARELGFPHGAEDFARTFGTQNWRAISEILRWTSDPLEIERISLRKELLYRQLLPGASEILLPGVCEFLAALAARGVPCAVVSSSPRLNIDVVIDGVDLRRYFRGVISSEDAARGKPDPDCYLLGAERVGLSPERCVVFEDAPVGIESGRRAGMRVVGLTTTHPASELRGAQAIVDGWSLQLVDEVCAWFEHAASAGAASGGG
jgi:HAD superfamily hydrolase (TIGR01509 family)